jgi:acyl-CoA thioesterase FadM
MHNLIARVAIDYVREACYRKPVHVRLRVTSIGTTSAIYEQAAGQCDDCVAFAEVVAVGRPATGVAPWPNEARVALVRLHDPTLPQPVALYDILMSRLTIRWLTATDHDDRDVQ